jgi:hypothetical protein
MIQFDAPMTPIAEAALQSYSLKNDWQSVLDEMMTPISKSWIESLLPAEQQNDLTPSTQINHPKEWDSLDPAAGLFSDWFLPDNPGIAFPGDSVPALVRDGNGKWQLNEIWTQSAYPNMDGVIDRLTSDFQHGAPGTKPDCGFEDKTIRDINTGNGQLTAEILQQYFPAAIEQFEVSQQAELARMLISDSNVYLM